MGAEALCRGASLVVGIEQSTPACRIIEQNWKQVAQSDQSYQVLRGDVVKRLANLSGQQFDRIYFDPPYDSEVYVPVLSAIATLNLLSQDGELAVEHRPGATFADIPLIIVRQKRYGNTALTFYQTV